MDTCKHGYTVCSECGHVYNNKVPLAFNNRCATIMGYKASYRSHSHFWLWGEDDFILQSQFRPYYDVTQLAEVIDIILADEPEKAQEQLVFDIIDTTVIEAFRKMVTEYNQEKDYE